MHTAIFWGECMAREPDFVPPQTSEMRALWRRHQDPDIRRLLLEINHLRNVLREMDDLRAVVDRAWKDDIGGQLVALEKMRYRLLEERVRRGLLDP
ncbi:hypothetical protein PPGU16_84700 (plasmid) [Paraburkholderia largidicola]|uniref:Uncharacterized protein n=2 Tax=Paraburkholderia largidicola TaxID=3014751 RepID=A0A7I8C3L7_9BURK|nr:hypothetical protein PPGU16_84700 [Paraburkholderia sp. PGU16]